MTNREIAQEISNRIGTAPVPFDSVYSIALEIYHQLGGEDSQFDSVYSILLEILPLAEGGGKAIEEVESLPDAEENKDKLFRVKGEDGIYAAKLLSSETITTNRLPDEQQIDNAYLYESEDSRYYYKGAYKIICSDGELNWYFWRYDDTGYATEDNAVLVNDDTNGVWVDRDDDNWTEVADTYAKTEFTIDELMNGGGDVLAGLGVTPIPAIYNAPESSQIGNAYLQGVADSYTGIYEGTQVTFIDTDKEVSGYKWTIEGNDEYYIATSKPASGIYYFKSYDNPEYYYLTDIMIWVVAADGTESERRGIESTDNNLIYIPQLNAPDSEQVDEASYTHIYDTVTQQKYIYKGEKNIHCSDGDYTTHIWLLDGSQITDFDKMYFTKNDANSCYSSENIRSTYGDIFGGIITIEGDNIYAKDKTVAELSQMMDENERNWNIADENILSTVKYQRTETIEDWDWANILEGGSAEAGENIEIKDNKISAIGYKAGNAMTASFVELPELIAEPYSDITSQLPSTDLYFTGDAGATQYEVSGQLVAMFGTMVGMVAFQVGSGNIAKFLALDSTNNIVTLDKSLDDNNALSAAQLSKLYMVIDVQISGDANVKTYSYVDSTGGAFHSLTNLDTKVKIGDYPLRTVTDITNNTIAFDETLDEENAVSNVKWMYSVNVNNNASGVGSHAEGMNTSASGNGSHAEGVNTTAFGEDSHAEGYGTNASGLQSHAEGNSTTASGLYSHSEGDNTVSEGTGSHAEGVGTYTQNLAEHAEGNNNLSHKANGTWGNAGNTLHSIGMAAGYTHTQKNAFEVMQNGDMYVFGVGGYQGTDTKVQDASIKTLQAYIASLEARINALEGNTTVE